MTTLDKQALASLLRATDAAIADLVAEPHALLELVPTPFFDGAAIYRVTVNLPSRPVVFTIGVAGGHASPLATHPTAFLELARRGRLDLTTTI